MSGIFQSTSVDHTNEVKCTAVHRMSPHCVARFVFQSIFKEFPMNINFLILFLFRICALDSLNPDLVTKGLAFEKRRVGRGIEHQIRKVATILKKHTLYKVPGLVPTGIVLLM